MSINDRGPNNGSDTDSNQPAKAAGLTAFQTNILTVLAEQARYGLAIKRELEDYYGKEVNHGRLYPNIDTLVDKGLIEKSERDKRTNNYELTEEGRAALEDDLAWRRQRITNTSEADA